jgi:hypothetical protein
MGECAYQGDPWGLHISRVGVGIVAGFVVALVKATADDTDFIAHLVNQSSIAIVKQVIGYALVPMVLGAVGGWISDENKVHKIFWVAISAPVIIAAAASGWSSSKIPQVLPVGKAGWNLEQYLPITPAYAEDLPSTVPTVEVAQADSPFVDGLRSFFGVGPGSQRYRVVVASINDYDKAKAAADRLNTMKVLPQPASVGDRKFGNEYFPVVVDGWQTYQAAKELRDKLASMDLGLPDAPYISVRDY